MSKTLKRDVFHFLVIWMVYALLTPSGEMAWGAEEPTPTRRAQSSAAGGAGGAESDVRMPMPINYNETADARWLKKPVLQSRLLDDMENPATWSHHRSGEMVFTSERCKDGKQSVRLLSPTFIDGPNASKGHVAGHAVLRREFGGEDWSQYNRLSFWVYPTLPGFQTISMLVRFHNDGKEKLPGPLPCRGAYNYIILKPDQWNHVVWEIPHLTRDKVTAVEFHYRLQGNEPGATTTVCYDFDHLELQKVDADHYEGWNVAPGRIAFSHTGYRLAGSKTAVASDLSAKSFKLIEADSGKTVLEKPIRTAISHIGRFQSMDFTEVRKPGTYFIQTGNVTTRPFRIGDDIWKRTIRKTINFFYCERCGFAVPGVHKVCHADWLGVHGDQKITINGGWHDAGDLSQYIVNTPECAAAMFSLAEKLQAEDPPLAKRLIEEARWGLDWVLKTRFDDGSRIIGQGMDRWTDGVLGTPDDVTAEAGTWPTGYCIAAAAEALAARVLKDTDPALAAKCLQTARDDWEFVATENYPHLLYISFKASAAMELFRTTGEQEYADRAIELADIILSCQQREVTDWTVPLAGFFYVKPDRKRTFHCDTIIGQEQAPIVVLAELCTAFPNHSNWMKWYSAVVLHSEHLKTLATFTAPYNMFPAGVYWLKEKRSDSEQYSRQVRGGIRLNEDYYLRMLPACGNRNSRGTNGPILSQARAALTAAHLRGDPELADLCERQLQWVVGRNPFVQSIMYGEGYDYAPQYAAMSGNMVGSHCVGIHTCLDRDLPYWPTSNCYNYKEVYVHPAGHWLRIMRDMRGPTRVVGQADAEKGKPIDFTLSQEPAGDGRVMISAKVERQSRVRLAIRTHNLEVDQPEQEAELKPGKAQIVTWAGRVLSTKEPWVAVIVPNGNLSERKEIIGWLPPRPTAPR